MKKKNEGNKNAKYEKSFLIFSFSFFVCRWSARRGKYNNNELAVRASALCILFYSFNRFLPDWQQTNKKHSAPYSFFMIQVYTAPRRE